MSMSKEEKITKIEEGIYLSTFKPEEDETIIVTADPNKVDLDEAMSVFSAVSKIFPKNAITLRCDGVTLESLLEDDLR